MLRTARVFAPGHLTGLFQICDQPEDPVRKGARGSGVSVAQGVHTAVTAEQADTSSHTVSINGDACVDAFVSERVIGKYLPQLAEPYRISVEHTLETPLTAGFGSSGGGALSLSLALNSVLQTGLSRVEAAQLAHVAEIECGTGLGSVFAANEGGFGVLFKPGAPGVGEGITYPEPRDLRVIYQYYGQIHTKEALANPELRRRINEMGESFVDELHRLLTPERFLHYSRRFTENVGLVTPRLRALFSHMDDAGFTFTMAMFGEVAFTVQHKSKVEAVLTALNEVPGADPVVCLVDSLGARFE